MQADGFSHSSMMTVPLKPETEGKPERYSEADRLLGDRAQGATQLCFFHESL